MLSTRSNINIIRIFTAAGFALAMVSLVHFINLIFGVNQEASFCNINAAFNCDAVNQSKWATLFDTPLAAYGGAFYIFIFLLTFLYDLKLRYIILTILSGLASLFSILLFLISEFQIGTLCLLCVGMYLINFLIFGLSLLQRKAASAVEGFSFPKALGSSALRLAVFSAFCLMFLFNVTRVSSSYLLKTNDFHRAWSKGTLTEFVFNDKSVLQKDYIKGPAGAPITVVEFSDLECSACRRFYLLLEDLLPDYKDKVRLVFKNFPLDRSCNTALKRDVHMTACFAAEFARCAGEQGKFWQTLDYIFRLDYSTYGYNRNLIREQLENSYNFLALDREAQLECMKSGRQLKKIASDLAEGQALELHATPSIWVNGKKISTYTEESLRNIFNGILQRE